MSISTFSIQRPVFTMVMSLVILVFGYIAYQSMGVREFPVIEKPVVTVATNYPGANAFVVEHQVTEPLEEQLNAVPGIVRMSSVSGDGRSTITLEFDVKTDINEAANDVRERTSRAVRFLPPEIDPPVTMKADPDAGSIFTITVQSDRRTLTELTEIGERTLKEAFQTIPGVSNVYIMGEKRYAIKVAFDPVKMAAKHIDIHEAIHAIRSQNVELPSGKLEGSQVEFSIRLLGNIKEVEQFEDVIISSSDAGVVRLKDIAKVRMGIENENNMFRGNGVIPMIGVAVQPMPGANFIDIVDEANKRLEVIKRDLPPDIITNWSIDQSRDIRKAIAEVKETIWIAFVLVILVIWFFLKNIRSTLVPVMVIPLSLMGSLIFIYISGYTINVLTLLGLVLATGIVVDDAIVVLENIYRNIENGMNRMEAAITGAKEVFFAVISTSITLICVFIPIFFIPGITGELFKEFSMVMIGAIVVSTFITLTLTPMICSRFLRINTANRGKEDRQKGNQIIDQWSNGYQRLLTSFMKAPWVSWVLFGVFFLSGYLLYQQIPKELSPVEDKSKMRVNVLAPEGTSFAAMDSFHLGVLRVMDTIPEKIFLLGITAQNFGVSTAVNSSYASITLVDPPFRSRSQQDIADMLTRIFSTATFAKINVTQDPTISSGRRGSRLPVQFILQAHAFEALKQELPLFMAEVEKSPVFSFSNVDLKFSKPELEIQINRNIALEKGITIEAIASTLQAFLGEQRLGYFLSAGKQYFIFSENTPSHIGKMNDIKNLMVRSNRGELVGIHDCLDIRMMSRPPMLIRNNRYSAATVSAALQKGYSIDDGIKEMIRIAKETLDERFTYDLAGESADYMESTQNTGWIFLLAILLVYLTLAAQFESFTDPLPVMITIPFAFLGALIALYLTGHTLHIFSQIGMVVLVGIVTKNAILIVEFANQKYRKGMSVTSAVTEAATQRLRPILMTSASTILGAVPIAFSIGQSSPSRTPMGMVIIGGLMFSLLLTLFIIPSFYVLFKKK